MRRATHDAHGRGALVEGSGEEEEEEKEEEEGGEEEEDDQEEEVAERYKKQ